jgi:uncharacterized protein (DUF4415 family)
MRFVWDEAKNQFYRRINQSLTIRLDADVPAWLKSHGWGYQTRINALLRGAMENQPGRQIHRQRLLDCGVCH